MSTLPKDEASRVMRPAGTAADAASADRGGARPVPPAPAPSRAGLAGPQLAPGVVIDGRYKIIRFLNQGGAGVVHEVEHVRTGRRLAMKTLVDDASTARLEQEARATSLMRNPHVVKITDMGPPPAGRGAPYLVMELLEGQTLRELLEEAGQLPLEMTVNIALQVCECLTEAHSRGVIHRDLKPDNLFLVKSAWPSQYDVVVLDFGVMKVAGEGPIPKGSLTRTGSTVGTPYYMSLEQLRNSSAVDARADIYSLGVVLYECLAGRKPFVADTIGDLVYALCSGPPTHLARLRPDLPAEVCELVMRTLKMSRDDRPPSMTEVGAALLSHGHPAFGLWLRAEGAAGPARAALVSNRDAAAKPVEASPPTPDEGEGETVTAVAPRRDEPDSLPVPTGPIPAVRADVPAAPAAARSDRDTPTEMYRSAFGGDRDTPTRALPVHSFADIENAARMTAVLPNAPDRPVEAASYGATHRILGPEANAALNTSPLPHRVETLQSAQVGPAPGVPTQPAPSGGEAPRFGPPPEPRATGTFQAASAPLAKPGWQTSLDGALSSVGALLESLVKKVRAQPPPIQYAVLGAGGVAALLVVVLFFVLVFR
ncbi:MAG: protein kinase [Polyangiaceae bacterium]|nr:protein kinase [Polyangiaceae bacterium]